MVIKSKSRVFHSATKLCFLVTLKVEILRTQQFLNKSQVRLPGDNICYFQLMVDGPALARGLDVVRNVRVALKPNPEAAITLLLDMVVGAVQGQPLEASRAIPTLNVNVSRNAVILLPCGRNREKFPGYTNQYLESL